MARATLLVLVWFATPARADRVAELVAQGELHAKQNEYTLAIAAFKRADAIAPRAVHACMIGLAYMRREAWPQAELFLALCEKRATPGDQPPDWIDAAHQQLAEKLRAAQIPAITIEVSPPGIGARLTVSSFTPDEQFDPQTIHLAAGKHVIEVAAPGYRAATREVLVASGVPQTIQFELEPADATAPTPPAPPTPAATTIGPTVDPMAPARARPSRIPWVLVGAGGALLATSLIYNLAVFQQERSQLDDAVSLAAYEGRLVDFRRTRNITIGLAASGAVVLGLGVALRLTMLGPRTHVTARVEPGGGVVAIGWQR